MSDWNSDYNNWTLHQRPIVESVCLCWFLQLSGLFTSLVVLIVLLLIGPLFHFLPKVCLYIYVCIFSLMWVRERWPIAHSHPASVCLSVSRRSWHASTSPACVRCSCSSETCLTCGESAKWILWVNCFKIYIYIYIDFRLDINLQEVLDLSHSSIPTVRLKSNSHTVH